MLDESFDPRARLPHPSPWSHAWGSDPIVDVTVRLPASARLLVLDRFPHRDVTGLPGGGYEVTFRWPEGGDLVRYLLSFGSGVEVVSPPQVRDSLKAASALIAALNR